MATINTRGQHPNSRPHTTIGLKKATKQRLDKARAPGQCYDGFLCQLVDFWEASIQNYKTTLGSQNVKPNRR